MLYNIPIRAKYFSLQMNMFHTHYSLDVPVETFIDDFSTKAISLGFMSLVIFNLAYHVNHKHLTLRFCSTSILGLK